jgi:hypothetical protein
MHFESGRDKGYVIYEIVNGRTSSSTPTLKAMIRFPFDGYLSGPSIQDDYLFARKPPNSVYVRHLKEEKNATFANPKPSFYTDFIGAVSFF